jgi:hypothetical protein
MPGFSTPHDTSTAGTATTLTLTLDSTAAVTTFTITNIQIANTRPGNAAQIDIAHLGQSTGESALRMDTPLSVPDDNGASGRQVTFDYIGKSVIFDGATGTYKITVAGANLLGGTTASYHTVQSSTLTLATNDAIRGQAVLNLSR